MLTDYSALVLLKHYKIQRRKRTEHRFKRTPVRRIKCLLGRHESGLIATGAAVILEQNRRYEERCCLRCGERVWARHG